MIEAPLLPDEVQRLRALHDLGVLYTPAEERFDRITRLACRTLNAPIALVSLVDETCQWSKSVKGMAATETPRRFSFCAHAILLDEAMVVADALEDERFRDNPLRDLAAIAETELNQHAMADRQQSLITGIGQLTRKTMLDALTHLWNREGILNILRGELKRAEREGKPVTLMLVDVDYFKRIDDTYGHPAADAVLAELAQRLRVSTRPYDAIGRYGGEEFLLVLGDCSEGTARQIAERIRLNVASESVAIAGKSVSVTVSMGITTWSAGMPASAEELIRVADEALARAKNSGRNRFVFAQT